VSRPAKPIKMEVLATNTPDERGVMLTEPRSGARATAAMWRMEPQSSHPPRLDIAVHKQPVVVMAPMDSTMIVGPGRLVNGAAAARCAELLKSITDKVEECRKDARAGGDREAIACRFGDWMVSLQPAIAEALARVEQMPVHAQPKEDGQ
jgi:hypothetical protein